MATDRKISELTAYTSALGSDLIPIVQSSSLIAKKITVDQLFTGRSFGVATATTINGLTISTTTGTLSLANLSTLATSGAFSITLTATGTTNVTLPTSGTLVASTVTALTALATVSTALTGVLRADAGVLSADTDITDLVTAASESVAGKIEIATAAEITTGTDATRAVAPDQLAASDFGKRVVGVQVVYATTNTATGDGQAFVRIPSVLNGYNLVAVAAHVYAAGTTNTTDIQLRRVRSGSAVDMLSTKITIDSTEVDTLTAAAAAVINASNDDVNTGDIIAVDVDAVSTTPATGLFVEMIFQLP
jgi:hypothetical protein